MDKAKVIKGLEYCGEYFNCCDKCPYWDGGTYCAANLAHDALALLKEKVAVVRCKECRYGEPAMNGAGEECIQCNNDDLWLDGNLNFPDWYCADGERR